MMTLKVVYKWFCVVTLLCIHQFFSSDIWNVSRKRWREMSYTNWPIQHLHVLNRLIQCLLLIIMPLPNGLPSWIILSMQPIPSAGSPSMTFWAWLLWPSTSPIGRYKLSLEPIIIAPPLCRGPGIAGRFNGSVGLTNNLLLWLLCFSWIIYF